MKLEKILKATLFGHRLFSDLPTKAMCKRGLINLVITIVVTLITTALMFPNRSTIFAKQTVENILKFF